MVVLCWEIQDPKWYSSRHLESPNPNTGNKLRRHQNDIRTLRTLAMTSYY